MTKSLYLIGGAGTGKSTLMANLLANTTQKPLEDFHSLRNAKALVTLRGHRLATEDGRQGLYLGVLRDEFPGTDGLDRATSPTGADWLAAGGANEFEFVVGEGATLATRPFMTALDRHTDLLLVELRCPEEELKLRFEKRGSSQENSFVTATVTRSRNLLLHMNTLGARVASFDTSSDWEYDFARESILSWVL